MKATIYHNPLCGTSRNTLALLEDAGAEVEVIEYLKAPPDKEDLRRLYDAAGITPREGLRAKESLARELALLDADNETILDAISQHPILIERPLVETEKGARLCRPSEKVHEIL